MNDKRRKARSGMKRMVVFFDGVLEVRKPVTTVCCIDLNACLESSVDSLNNTLTLWMSRTSMYLLKNLLDFELPQKL